VTGEAGGEAADTGPSRDALSQLRHDLRTPLNQIIGYSELLQEEAEDRGLDQFAADLRRIQAAARHLLGTINEQLVPGGLGARAHAAAGQRADGAEPASGDSPPAHAGVDRQLQGRVLVVDDNEANRDMLARRLERAGCTVATADSGNRALEATASQPFDLVLLDVMMPGLDGYAVLTRLKSDPARRDVPVIMISALDEIASVVRCIEIGADDYLPKPFDPTLLRARVGACLDRKALRDQERLTYRALVASQKQLAGELADAADYVESLLPAPLAGRVSAEWRFIPSTSLGGDAFGYRWIDPDHFGIYLLDVCGHGVGAALLSMSVMNVLNSHSLQGADFREPGEVLRALGDAFQMDRQNDMYFTIWYGVYRASARQLTYASGGHPPAVLVGPGERPDIELLDTRGMVAGFLPGTTYATRRCDVAPGSRLFVFSDGAYEITRAATGETWTLDAFVEQLARPSGDGSDLDRLVADARNMHGRSEFDDDVSIVRFLFA
jgi:sigma-B regulation protein RsbU (phosphoserine phosphatase)